MTSYHNRCVGLQTMFLLSAACICLPAVVHAEVLHWWRFEDGAFLEDSVGGVSLTVPPDDEQGSVVEYQPLSSGDRGRHFPSTLGAKVNAGMADFQRASRRGLVGLNSTEVTDDFTIELFTHIDDLSEVKLAANLAGQVTEALNKERHGWAFKVRMDGCCSTVKRELHFANSDGSHWQSRTGSGILIDEGVDYYLAGAFDLDGQEMTYYAHNLGDNSLQISNIPHSMARLNPDSTMLVGDADCSCSVDGLIDEVRLSSGVVPFNELLTLTAGFDQSGPRMPDSVWLGPRAIYRADGTRSVDLRQLAGASIDEGQTTLAKFDLPPIGNAAELMDEAKLRVFISSASGAGQPELSLWHSITDNDFEVEPEDAADTSYTDTVIDIFSPGDEAMRYFEVDVTDLVRENYLTDNADPVAAFRWQGSADSRFWLSMPRRVAQQPQLVLSFLSKPDSLGDLNGNGSLDVNDLDLLTAAVLSQDLSFDLNSDDKVDQEDRQVWVQDLKKTWFGDANLDGEFNSRDIVALLGTGEYEDSIPLNSTWATGDFNGDRDFTSGDIVTILGDGGYELGPRIDVNPVPEPTSLVMLIVGMIGIANRCCPRARRSRAFNLCSWRRLSVEQLSSTVQYSSAVHYPSAVHHQAPRGTVVLNYPTALDYRTVEDNCSTILGAPCA